MYLDIHMDNHKANGHYLIPTMRGHSLLLVGTIEWNWLTAYRLQIIRLSYRIV